MDSIVFSTFCLPRNRWNCPSNMIWATRLTVYPRKLTPTTMSRTVNSFPPLPISWTSLNPTVPSVITVM